MSQNVFPVVNSTLSAPDLAVWIQSRYALTNVGCTLLKTNMNHTYQVRSDEGQFVLRVYTHLHRSRSQVMEEVSFLDTVKDSVSVSHPVADVDGNLVQEIIAPEGIRYAVLFSFAEGGKIRHLSEAQSRAIGIQTGHLHQVGLDYSLTRMEYTAETLIDWAHEQASMYISPELEEMQFIRQCAQEIKRRFGRRDLERGVVHLDIWYDNLAVDESENVTLFDFDNCGGGWLVLDLGYYCMQLYFTQTDKSEYERKKAAFIEGYRSVRPIPDEALQMIPYAGAAVWIHYLGVQAQRFDSFANIFLSENYVRMYIGRVREWLEYTGEIPPGK